jgi:hypothetical protein
MMLTPHNGIELPSGRNLDLPFAGISTFQLTFDEPVYVTAADVTITSVRGMNYGPVTVTGSGTSYTITLAQPINKADRITISVTIAGALAFSGYFNVLPGDVNDDGLVNSKDVALIKKDLKGKGTAANMMFGSLSGSSTVTRRDLSAIKSYLSMRLPELKATHPRAKLARTMVRPHHDVKQR